MEPISIASSSREGRSLDRRPRGRVLLALVALVASVTAVACGGPGPYGHAAEYAPLPQEAAAAEGARPFDPVMVERDPEGFRKGTVSLFGVVTSRAPGPNGQASLVVGLRRLEPRNLCSNARDESTCRVTVSDREFGVVRVLVGLRPGDDTGASSVGAGSLVRVVGTVGDDVAAEGGMQVVRATYYRHWPRHTYVTQASAETMRQ